MVVLYDILTVLLDMVVLYDILTVLLDRWSCMTGNTMPAGPGVLDMTLEHWVEPTTGRHQLKY